MKTEEVRRILEKYIGKPFKAFLSDSQLESIATRKNGKGYNKGLLGNIVQVILAGVAASSNHLDFEDGELKTFVVKNGKALGTLCLTMMSSTLAIDAFLNLNNSYEESAVYTKIQKLLLVPIDKTSKNPAEWFISDVFIIESKNPYYADLYAKFENDFYTVRRESLKQIMSGQMMKTRGVKVDFLQIRTKAGKKLKDGTYQPLHSALFHRNVSNKSRAFFFKQKALREIMRLRKEEQGLLIAA